MQRGGYYYHCTTTKQIWTKPNIKIHAQFKRAIMREVRDAMSCGSQAACWWKSGVIWNCSQIWLGVSEGLGKGVFLSCSCCQNRLKNAGGCRSLVIIKSGLKGRIFFQDHNSSCQQRQLLFWKDSINPLGSWNYSRNFQAPNRDAFISVCSNAWSSWRSWNGTPPPPEPPKTALPVCSEAPARGKRMGCRVLVVLLHL